MDINDMIVNDIVHNNPTIEQRLISNARLEICNTCPHKAEETASTNDGHQILFWRCMACGCPIIPKSHRMQSGLCPLNSWNDIENQML